MRNRICRDGVHERTPSRSQLPKVRKSSDAALRSAAGALFQMRRVRVCVSCARRRRETPACHTSFERGFYLSEMRKFTTGSRRAVDRSSARSHAVRRLRTRFVEPVEPLTTGRFLRDERRLIRRLDSETRPRSGLTIRSISLRARVRLDAERDLQHP